jgi:hypothetical protein
MIKTLQFRTAANRTATAKECLWASSPPMMMKNPQFRTAANRTATARSGNDSANFKRYLNGLVLRAHRQKARALLLLGVCRVRGFFEKFAL